MAQRRMFSKTITNSSQFLMMPSSSQNLYFHLGMNADDDGFCEHFTVMRMTDSKPDDLRILQAKGYVHVFDDKVLVILQWKENNCIKSDRYTPSKYLEEYKKQIKEIEYSSRPAAGVKPGWQEKREGAYSNSSLPYSFSYKVKRGFIGKPCIICGEIMGSTRLNKPSIQHNVPLSKGGEHEIDNISVICNKCNSSIKETPCLTNNTEEVRAVWIAIGTNRDTQDRIGKDREGENRIAKQVTVSKTDKIPEILAAVISDDLRASLSEWIDSRKGTKTPVTAQALTLGISELERLYPSDYDKQVRCVNQTVISGWRGFFELRNSQAGAKKKVSSYPDLDAPKVGA